MINKCGLDINTPRWGQPIIAACASSQSNSWAGSSAKIQIIFKKRQTFYNSASAQIEIPPTGYRAVEMLVLALLFKWKIDRGLGSRSESVAVKAVPGQAGADHNQIGETSHGVASTSLPAPFSGPSEDLGARKDLPQALRPWLFSSSAAPTKVALGCAWVPLEKDLQGVLTAILLQFLQKGGSIMDKESLQKPTWAASRFVHPLMGLQSWN